MGEPLHGVLGTSIGTDAESVLEEGGPLPSQLESRLRINTPGRRLAFAVVHQAIQEAAGQIRLVQGRHKRSQPQPQARSVRLVREARAWIESERRGVYTFEELAEHIGLDPGAARAALRKGWRPL